MKFDNIIANPPYAKIGCDITKKVIEQNPTDSHYRCVKWGFVQGLKAHERFNEQ